MGPSHSKDSLVGTLLGPPETGAEDHLGLILESLVELFLGGGDENPLSSLGHILVGKTWSHVRNH